MLRNWKNLAVPQKLQELPAPRIRFRAGAPIVDWEELVPLRDVPTQWLIFWVRRIVDVPSWLRCAASAILLQRAESGTLDDGSLDRIDIVSLPFTLEEAWELIRSACGSRSAKDVWQQILEDFVRWQRRACGRKPLPIFAE